MAKKKATKSAPVERETVRNPEGADKVRFELRFDRQVYEQVRRLADETGVSINQLMQGLARWGASALKPGEPQRDDNGYVSVREQPGCLWAGRHGRGKKISSNEFFDENGREPMCDDELWERDVSEYGKGEVYVFLDFTERRVVRDDIPAES